jgi:aminoacylase
MNKPQFDPKEQETALSAFSEFLKFKTVSGTGAEGAYSECVNFLRQKCEECGLACYILPESVPGKPILTATWTGTDPLLPCLLLNSHYDVVPVVEDQWSVPAFEGLRQDGRIYGRGAQDMKCVCIQYIYSLMKLKAQGFVPRRTVHLSFVPDEEVGGVDGMCVMLESGWFKAKCKDIAIALDEGLASEDDAFSVYYGERLPWWVRIKASGNTGHGSRFIENTAVEHVISVVNKALTFRRNQKDILHGKGCDHTGCTHSVAGKNKSKKTLGDVTSLNVTALKAGITSGGRPILNVIPNEAEACFDIRISPHMPPAEMKAKLDQWCAEASVSSSISSDCSSSSNSSSNVMWEFVNPGGLEHATTATNASNEWWVLFEKVFSSDIGIQLKPEVFPAATDSRFLRALGVKAFGFSPMRNSPILLHEHDEYLSESAFTEGLDVYGILLRRLAE